MSRDCRGDFLRQPLVEDTPCSAVVLHVEYRRGLSGRSGSVNQRFVSLPVPRLQLQLPQKMSEVKVGGVEKGYGNDVSKPAYTSRIPLTRESFDTQFH